MRYELHIILSNEQTEKQGSREMMTTSPLNQMKPTLLRQEM